MCERFRLVFRWSVVFGTVLALSNGVHAQWTYDIAPYGRHLNDVQTFDGQLFTTVGGNPSNDALQSVFSPIQTFPFWSIQLDVFGDWLHGMSFLTPQLGFVVGYNGALLKTSDGTTWTTLTVPVEVNTHHFLGIDFLTSQSGVAVGGLLGAETGQTIIGTENGGADWTVQHSQSGPILRDVSFANNQIGVAVGDNGTALRTDNGGDSWNVIAIPTEVQSRDFHAVTMLSGNRGLIVGGQLSNDSIQTVLRTTDGGQNWEVVRDALGPMLRDVCSAGTTSFYAVGNRGTVLFSDDDGSVWNSVNIDPEVNDTVDLNAVHFANADFGTAVGNHGKVLRFESLATTTPSVQTETASELTVQSAQLNGSVNPNGGVATVTFQYGTTTALGNTVSASPATITGSGSQHVSTSLEGLSAGIHYFRVVADNSSGTAYGQIRPLYVGQPDIPNWDFELWDTVTVERPSIWTSGGTTTKTASYDGTWAAQFNTQVEPGVRNEASYVVHGEVDDFEFRPGLAIDVRPDSLAAHLRYDIESSDTAYVLIMLKRESQPLAFHLFPLTGSTGGVFLRHSFALTYTSAETPDSLLIGIVNTNVLADTAFPNSVVTMDNLHFPGEAYSIPNADFESWEWRSRVRALDWYTKEVHRMDTTIHIYPVSESVSGLYSALLVNEMPPNYHGAVSLKTTPNSFNDFRPSFSVSARYTTLNGYYRYMPVGNDTLRITVAMFSNGDPIGFSTLELTEPESAFTPFEMMLQYHEPNVVPDSALLEFQFTDTTIRGSMFWIDNLGFDGYRQSGEDIIVNQPDEQISTVSQILVYPNPTAGALHVNIGPALKDHVELELFDISGRSRFYRVLPPENENLAIDLSELKNGLYLLRITSHSQKMSKVFRVVVSR